jgi:hypothetical protein
MCKDNRQENAWRESGRRFFGVAWLREQRARDARRSEHGGDC